MGCKQILTVIVTKYETVDSVETKQIEQVPAERGYPSNVKVGCVNATLEHQLEPQSEGERKLDCLQEKQCKLIAPIPSGTNVEQGQVLTEDKTAKEKVDPAHDDSLRDHHDHLLLHTVHHGVHSAVGRVEWVLWSLVILLL